MEKVSEKQGSSTVDMSIRMMAASSRHHNRAPAVAANRKMDKYSIFTVHFLICWVIYLNLHYRWMAQHRKRSASYFDAYKAGNSRERTSHHSTVQMIWRVCPVRMNLKSSCYLQSTAAGITKPEAKRVNDSWSCESNDESADDANTTNGKSKLHNLPTGLE